MLSKTEILSKIDELEYDARTNLDDFKRDVFGSSGYSRFMEQSLRGRIEKLEKVVIALQEYLEVDITEQHDCKAIKSKK